MRTRPHATANVSRHQTSASRCGPSGARQRGRAALAGQEEHAREATVPDRPMIATRRLLPEHHLSLGSRDRHQRSGGLTVRAIDYRLPVEGVGGAEPFYRLLTTILDPDVAPAHELAALYHERWEIETALDDGSRPICGGNARVVLRSKTPDLVRQEFYGLMMAHFAIRSLIHEAALKADEDPDRLSCPSRRARGVSKAARRHGSSVRLPFGLSIRLFSMSSGSWCSTISPTVSQFISWMVRAIELQVWTKGSSSMAWRHSTRPFGSRPCRARNLGATRVRPTTASSGVDMVLHVHLEAGYEVLAGQLVAGRQRHHRVPS